MTTSLMNLSIFARENLFAWCIASHDPPERTAVERAAMLRRLGITGYGWGNRMGGPDFEPAFEAEMDAMQDHGIELVGRYVNKSDDVQQVIRSLRRRHLAPQLWISPGHPSEGKSDARRAEDEAARLRGAAEAAGEAGLAIGLYNHGGWFGDPRNMIAIIERLRAWGVSNVGIAHCQHWGHDHIEYFEDVLRVMAPHLFAFMLSGMTRNAAGTPQQFLPVGAGDEDLRLLRALACSGWGGPVGLINHTASDAEARLRDHLDGLDWLLPQLRGQAPGPLLAFRCMPEDQS